MLSSNLRALLACARAVLDVRRLPEFRAAVAQCESMDRLLETAVSQKMLGHLHRLLTRADVAAEDATPYDPVLLSRVRDLQRASAERSLRMARRVLRLLEVLRQAGVEALPYKGPALAERLYGDTTLRWSEDIDLIVRHDQAELSRKALLAEGFQDMSAVNAEIIRQKRGRWDQIMLVSPDEPIFIDLHWDVLVWHGGHPLTAERLLARSGPQRLLGREIPGLSSKDLLLVSCLQGTKDGWCTIEGLLGMAIQVQSVASGAVGSDWPEIMTAAREAACLRRLIVGVGHACRVLRVDTPPEVLEGLAQDWVARKLLASLHPDDLGWAWVGNLPKAVGRLVWATASEDSLPVGLRRLLARMVRPGPADWQWVTLPAHAEWLYFFLRPVRLAVRLAKRL